MRVSFKGMSEEGLQFEGSLKDAWVNTMIESLDLGPFSRLNIKAEAHPSAMGVLFQASIDGSCAATCDRCLKEYSQAIHDPAVRCLVVQRYPVAKDHEDEDDSLDDEDPGIHAFDGPFFEAGDVLREYIILATPLKYLCQSSCRGLCARCGVDLNEKPCSCPV